MLSFNPETSEYEELTEEILEINAGRIHDAAPDIRVILTRPGITKN